MVLHANIFADKFSPVWLCCLLFREKVQGTNPTNAMLDVPDADNESAGDEKESTINTYPQQSSQRTSDPVIEEKANLGCEDGQEPSNTLPPQLSTSDGLDITPEEGKELLSNLEPIPNELLDEPTTDAKELHDTNLQHGLNIVHAEESSILWSPRLILAILVVLVSCCSNVIFLELLVRQVRPCLNREPELSKLTLSGSWNRKPGYFFSIPGDCCGGLHIHYKTWDCWPRGPFQVVDHPGCHVLHGQRHQQLRAQLPCSHALAHDLPGGQPDGEHADGDGLVGQALQHDQVYVRADDHHRHRHLHGDVGDEQGELEDGQGGVQRG